MANSPNLNKNSSDTVEDFSIKYLNKDKLALLRNSSFQDNLSNINFFVSNSNKNISQPPASKIQKQCKETVNKKFSFESFKKQVSINIPNTQKSTHLKQENIFLYKKEINSKIKIYKNQNKNQIMVPNFNQKINKVEINSNKPIKNSEENHQKNSTSKKQKKDPDSLKIILENLRNKTDMRTTVMLANIPNKYTQSMLISLLDENSFGDYRFVYLRMDFMNDCNVGYAFIDFKDPEALENFFVNVHGKSWKRFQSNKIINVTYATIQGEDNLIKKFKRSKVMNQQREYRPICFNVIGVFKGMPLYYLW